MVQIEKFSGSGYVDADRVQEIISDKNLIIQELRREIERLEKRIDDLEMISEVLCDS